ncbi:hypothetical protein ACFV4P_03030 [Kitasatospora sp. NPDC059795]
MTRNTPAERPPTIRPAADRNWLALRPYPPSPPAAPPLPTGPGPAADPES